MEIVKCVCLGDSNIGKNSLLEMFLTDIFPAGQSVLIDSHTAIKNVDGKQIKFNLWKMPSYNEYKALRAIAYPGTDVFLLAFSIGNRNSFESVKNYWLPESCEHYSHVPTLLVGLKLDLRYDVTTIKNLRKDDCFPVAYSEGVAMAKEIGAVKYVECSALMDEMVEEVFIELAKVATSNDFDKCVLS